MGNWDLNKAKEGKKDEFYTTLETIEEEVMHYRPHFKGKTVYLNCDDPRESNFFHYFSYNFERLGLKKLIASCYKSQDYNLFSLHDTNEKAVWLEYTGEKDGGRVPTAEAIGIHEFEGDGDFRSQESIELLKEADIVVTNPPFSLFREFIAQVVEHDKQFLVLGNLNAITYKEIFPLIRDNKVWFGPSIRSGDREFMVPDNYPLSASGSRVDELGNKYIRVKGVRWFTNLEFSKGFEDLILYRYYNEKDYPRYDNYDAVNVDITNDIPKDYNGTMGVPITFMDKYNPEQFEILCSDFQVDTLNPELKDASWTGKFDRGYVDGRRKYSRILIRNKRLQDVQDDKEDNNGE